MLRFPYDDGLRRLLRAIPGRRWDPEQRAWCLPLEAEQAEALARAVRRLPSPPEVDERSPARSRAAGEARPAECLVDLARPDERWWLSFSTDGPPELLERLLDHPEADRLDAIGRALIPLDDHSAATVRSLARRRASPERATPARRCASARAQAPRVRATGRGAPRRRVPPRPPRRALDPDRAPSRAARARARRAGARCEPREGPAGSVAAAAVERDAEALRSCWPAGGCVRRPRVARGSRARRAGAGTIEVDGPREAPVFLLLGDFDRLPRALRERARACRAARRCRSRSSPGG